MVRFTVLKEGAVGSSQREDFKILYTISVYSPARYAGQSINNTELSDTASRD